MRPVQKRVYDPSAPSNERLIGEIFSGTKYKVTYEASMGDHLLCRAAFWLAHRGKCLIMTKIRQEGFTMYELIQVSGSSYYVQSPAKIGLVRLNDTDVCFIDSGSDKDAGRKARQILDKNGWRLTAIYNTHSHADHIGGNRYLQGQTGCRIYAPGAECAFTRHPILEPSLLYGGCPPRELRHKFLMAQESDAAYLTAEVLPQGMELLPLPGHCMDMAGFRTPDNVVYLADCLSSRETLEKYRIGYIYDVGAYLATLETVEKWRPERSSPLTQR